MRTIKAIALTLAIIGAINWGLIGIFDFNLAAFIFGGIDSTFTKIIYIIIGISGIISLKTLIDIFED